MQKTDDFTWDGQLDLISDLHKDVFGFRPGATYLEAFWSLTESGQQNVYDDLCAQLEQNQQEEKVQEQAAVEEFQARIEDVIGLGAGNRLTALSWITGQEKFYHIQDVEHFVWEQGILFTDYGKKLVKELLTIVKYEVDYV